MTFRTLGSVLCIALTAAAANKGGFPAPPAPSPAEASAGPQKAVFAGGCFWGVEGVFENLKGVSKAVSGYAGGVAKTAHYEMVGSGSTGHAESVEVTYDPSKISYGQLLEVFFAVAHDPTEKNRQGPDTGTQYRSAIFYANEQQKQTAETYIRELNAARVFGRPIATEVSPLRGFFAAEDYHQKFLQRNPDYPYIVYNDLPKIENLKKQFPELTR
ncbi:MAG TPA: peptide-methionine (S)-S-oxide reductase MsrA [Candidatus Sulfopaludibacter sp.]|nr:peptide-methionine (S)-S-oxide reductase MsrA [Candidatus Sulfopaludibacter sp.]